MNQIMVNFVTCRGAWHGQSSNHAKAHNKRAKGTSTNQLAEGSPNRGHGSDVIL
jgi:hypothetical protein